MATRERHQSLVAVLSYLLIGIIWYAVDDSVKGPLTKFHVKQALNLFLISALINIFYMILSVITFGVLTIILAPAYFILEVALLVLWVIGIVYALQQEERPVPLVGKFAEKYLDF